MPKDRIPENRISKHGVTEGHKVEKLKRQNSTHKAEGSKTEFKNTVTEGHKVETQKGRTPPIRLSAQKTEFQKAEFQNTELQKVEKQKNRTGSKNKKAEFHQ